VKPHRPGAHKKGSADFRQRGLAGITHSPGQPLSVRRSYSSRTRLPIPNRMISAFTSGAPTRHGSKAKRARNCETVDYGVETGYVRFHHLGKLAL
jgi:outer membrane receptor protein involved in Fe transport